MTPTQALNNLQQAALAYNGNREAHIALEQSYRVLKSYIEAQESSAGGLAVGDDEAGS
jgi:hypothetical protein